MKEKDWSDDDFSSFQLNAGERRSRREKRGRERESEIDSEKDTRANSVVQREGFNVWHGQKIFPINFIKFGLSQKCKISYFHYISEKC